MGQYYGIQRSEEYLAHYGVKGMRWGVRKAIERGESQRLSKQYSKAVKKLAQLSLKANRGLQEKLYDSAKKRMVSGALGSAVASAGLTASLHTGKPNDILKDAGIAGAAGLVGGALLNGKGIGSRRYISDRGHAKAIAKRNKWHRDMEEVFKETRYGGKGNKKFHQQIIAISDQKNPVAYVNKQQNKMIRELTRNTANQIRRNNEFNRTVKDGFKSAGIGSIAGGAAANAHTAKRIGFDSSTRTAYIDTRSNAKRQVVPVSQAISDRLNTKSKKRRRG